MTATTGRVIDSHLHLWNLERGGYAWLTPDAGELYANFEPAKAGAELARAHVDGAVLVQADDTEADTEAMLRVADEHDWVAGVVGWVRLDEPSAAEAQLDRWQEHPRFCGVRHLVHDDPRDDFLELPAVRRSLELLAARDVPFDVPDAWPRHLASVTALASALPELTVVIDHLGKPPRGRPDFVDWRAEFERAAERPNTVAKLSGLRIPGAGYSVDALREVWDIALDSYGPERLLWGSDWPITVPDGGYGPTFEVLEKLVGELSDEERHAVLGATAAAVYSLQISDV
ncbi:amidohydrolase family protein [Herbiconiux sp. CPCC 205763]|uniref:Amidohydrolase family protein n=1 Tax=Herbiconiux aconitum TaxID=2970913 RepID=A0ABT2GQJ9_9MICO|nr:amidohydrolase family protein [Herbiconiux aconitum]MCS5718497.1 amidohydrolase family protein [Herbiconiux aconitum]